ncbi:hypothetical protein P4V43_25290 [Brevibacillus fortis]|uniref:hypothetical protein n=1 Tax=Brevibacillus fortis TaxID=2126352 RepID=UPI002E1F6D87|nr:hypothetical protein [Brevibacillus fortis]
MLDLASPAWEKLQGPYGFSDRVPALIQHIQHDYFSEEKEELYWELLYHQNTIYPCTYAAVPYLVEIALKTQRPDILLDIFVTCGIFEANNPNAPQVDLPLEFLREQTQLEPDTIQEIYREYHRAIQSLSKLTELLFQSVQSEEQAGEKRYVLAADAAFRGDKDIASMLLTYLEGDEYVIVCPTCDTSLYLWPDEEKSCLYAYEEDPVSHGIAKPFAINPNSQTSTQDTRYQALFRQVCEIDEPLLLAHLPYLAGEMNCCSCDSPMLIWTELLSEF